MRWLVFYLSAALLVGCAAQALSPSAPPRPKPGAPGVSADDTQRPTPPGAAKQEGEEEPGYNRGPFDALPAEIRTWSPSVKPACHVGVDEPLDDRRLRFPGGTVQLPEDLLLVSGAEHLHVLPYNQRAVLLAAGNGGEHAYIPVSSKLWLLTCDGSQPLVEAYGLKHGDLGNVLASSDSRWLYFRGLSRLDLSSLDEHEPRVKTIQLPSHDYRPECWGGAEVESTYLTPMAWLEPDRVMLTTSATHCGFEGDPLLEDAVVSGLDHEMANLRVRSPVATVVVDPSGALWLGDGGRCEMPGSFDASADGYVWRSVDRGDSWDLVPTPAGAIAQLGVRGQTIVALSGACDEYSSHDGDLFVSTDLGKSWRQFAFAASDLRVEDDNGMLLHLFTVLSWSPLRVRAWRTGYSDKGEPVTETWEAAFVPMPAGERVVKESASPWKRVAARPSATRSDKEASLGNARFEATHDGLVRHIGPQSETVFRTRDYWRALDWQGDRNNTDDRKLLPSDVPSEWEKGCRSRPEVLAGSDPDAQRLVSGSLSVVSVGPRDVLQVRRVASPHAEVVTSLAFDAQGLRPTGNVCKMASGTWVQVAVGEDFGWANAKFLQVTPLPTETRRRVF